MALEEEVRFLLISVHLYLTSCFTADGGLSARITLSAMMTTALMAVPMYLL